MAVPDPRGVSTGWRTIVRTAPRVTSSRSEVFERFELIGVRRLHAEGAEIAPETLYSNANEETRTS